MTSLLSPRRHRSPITLSATEAQDRRPPSGPQDSGSTTLLWAGVAAAGALVTALAGWVLVAGLSVVAWLSAAPGTLTQTLGTGTELWLLANGAGARLGSSTITLMPWGVTLLIAFMVARAAGVAANLAREAKTSVVAGVSVVLTATYLAVLISVALLCGHPVEILRGSVVMALTVGAAAVWGSSRAAGVRLTRGGPTWARQIPHAVLAAQLVLLAVGAALLLVAAIARLGRLESLLVALDPGVVGNITLLLLQVAFLPNLMVWSASYALGAGFGLGAGSVVAPAGTSLGLLPGIPILGALPSAGPAGEHQLWWLAGGILAGVVAAVVVVLGRPSARCDETSVVGGLAGAVSGAVFVVLAWLSSGALGAARLADLGPRLLPLLILAVTTLGLAGLVAGFLLGLVRGHLLPWRRERKAAKNTVTGPVLDSDPEMTVSLSGPRSEG